MLDSHLFTELSRLDRVDKLRIMQFLVIELAKEEGLALEPNAHYAIWSPYNSYEAAGTLARMLKEDRPKESYG